MSDPVGGFDWAHALSAAGGSIVGALAAAGGFLFRAGAKEPTIRLDFEREITHAENRFEGKVRAAAAAFDETLRALRQKINDVELEMVRGFVSKPDFDDFRSEYREDQKRTDDKLDKLLGMRQ